MLQELLQLIHLHAADYYSEHGLLSKTTRRHKGKGKEREIMGKDSASGNQRPIESSLDSSVESDSSSSSESSMESAMEEEDAQAKPSERLRSMNRSLDGSALLAIGRSRLPSCFATYP